MSRHRSLAVLTAVAGLSGLVVPSASAGCGGWGCQPACEAPAFFAPPVVACAGPLYRPQPAYRVEQGPIYNVVVIPYEEPRLRFVYLPPRFSADCACYR